jgi:uncharacterized membrane protein
MNSWHPVVVHLPLVALVLAVAFDGVGYLGGDLVYRHALAIPAETLDEIAKVLTRIVR